MRQTGPGVLNSEADLYHQAVLGQINDSTVEQLRRDENQLSVTSTIEHRLGSEATNPVQDARGGGSSDDEDAWLYREHRSSARGGVAAAVDTAAGAASAVMGQASAVAAATPAAPSVLDTGTCRHI